MTPWMRRAAAIAMIIAGVFVAVVAYTVDLAAIERHSGIAGNERLLLNVLAASLIAAGLIILRPSLIRG